MKTSIITLALILSASSFSFADHNHYLSNCQVVQYQDYTEGRWEKQFVPAVYRTVRVFDHSCRAYVQKQILVTPACYKNVWVPGCAVTKTRYICTPVVRSHTYVPSISTSIHFGERAPYQNYRTNNFRSYPQQDRFRTQFQKPTYNSSFYRNYNDFNRGHNNNDFRRGNNDYRRGNNDFRRGDNESRRGNNDFRRGNNGSR